MCLCLKIQNSIFNSQFNVQFRSSILCASSIQFQRLQLRESLRVWVRTSLLLVSSNLEINLELELEPSHSLSPQIWKKWKNRTRLTVDLVGTQPQPRARALSLWILASINNQQSSQVKFILSTQIQNSPPFVPGARVGTWLEIRS